MHVFVWGKNTSSWGIPREATNHLSHSADTFTFPSPFIKVHQPSGDCLLLTEALLTWPHAPR